MGSSAAADVRRIAEPRRDLITRLLPLTADLSRRQARMVGLAGALLCAVLAAMAVCELFQIGGSSGLDFVRDSLGSAAFVLVVLLGAARLVLCSQNRRTWGVFVAGGVLACVSWVMYLLWVSNMRRPPDPSVCDVLWLCAYPLVLAGVVGLGRHGVERRIPARVWLDGVIAGAGMAAVVGAFLIPVIGAVSGRAAVVVTGLAYPLADMLVLALLFGVLALRGWRWQRLWALLIVAFLISTTSDVIVAAAGIATGKSGYSALPDWLFTVQFALVAFAAWQPDPKLAGQRLAHWSVLLLPTGFTVAALVLLTYNQFVRLPVPVFVLAIATLLAVSLRMALAFRDIVNLADARRQAMTDELTGLPNRRLFLRRLENSVTAGPPGGRGVSVILLDLDNFKLLNDTLGHEAGDELLRMIGPRLRRALHDADTIARLGGDEFAILLDPEPDAARIERVVQRLLGALREPFQVHGVSFRLTASIGIASFPDHADSPAGLMKCADVAMYLAKESQRGWEFYSADRDLNSKERLMLASDLASALENGEIEAHYQPIADARTREIVGAEALARWRRPDGTVLAPNDFIPAAERAGLSRALTRRMLGLALEQLQAWRADGHDLRISVNTTVADLLDIDFPDEVATSLADSGVPACALVLEVTETSILSDPVRIGAVLTRLRELGIDVALDDFGTGYSSLAHLRTLSIAEVKIDRSFVMGMTEEPADAAIVYATIELVHKLGHDVVAEGVEDDRTWDALNELGCDRIQGYAVGKPIAPDAFWEVLTERRDVARSSPVPLVI